MIVVADAGPLVALAAVGHFDLLRHVFGEIVVAPQVWEEVVVRGAGRPGAQEASRAAWVKVVGLRDQSLLRVWRGTHRLGSGEAATILLAKELAAAVALIDERRARRLAKTEGVPVSGSIAVLESGYRRGELKDLRRVYAGLLAAGIRVGLPVLNQSLTDFGLPPL
ncbi:MAG TPA: DUF3368 domain-containing protein [Blastocatellia bacterium]|nr:DUF3368 domain-containing protein [Blastocatellia bacterium]